MVTGGWRAGRLEKVTAKLLVGNGEVGCVEKVNITVEDIYLVTFNGEVGWVEKVNTTAEDIYILFTFINLVTEWGYNGKYPRE